MTLVPYMAMETVLDPRPDSTWLRKRRMVLILKPARTLKTGKNRRSHYSRILAAPTIELLPLVLDGIDVAIGLADADDEVRARVDDIVATRVCITPSGQDDGGPEQERAESREDQHRGR